MAAREHQGLQIALIIFVMLTMIYITGALEEAEHEAHHAPTGHH